MPSLRQIVQDYALPVGSQVAGGLVARRGVSNATSNLTNGVNRAMDTTANVYADQKKTLQPFKAAGESTLPGLTAGVAPGGEFNKPFTMKEFEAYRDPMLDWRIQQGERRIKAENNAGGIRFSGATLKAISDYNAKTNMAEETAAYGRYQDDLSGRFGRVMDVEGIGERAAGAEVNAGSQYGRNLADLQTDLASAQAAGDIAGASAITDAINGIVSNVEGVGDRKAWERVMEAGGTVGSTARPLSKIATVGGGIATKAGGGSVAAKVAADGTVFTGGSTGALSSVSSTLGLGGSPGFLGIGAATIPVIGAVVAGAVIGSGLWKKAQTSAKADKWVEVQNPFDAQMDAINRSAPPEQKQQLQRAVVTDYLAAAMEFASKGKDHATVIRQAMETFRKYYPQFAAGVA